MNTQLTERPATQTPATDSTKTAATRPRPVWTDHEDVAQPSASSRRRSRRLALAAALVVAGSTSAIVLAATNDGSKPDPAPTQRPVFGTPGGNSLNMPSRVEGSATVSAPSGFGSPGGPCSAGQRRPWGNSSTE